MSELENDKECLWGASRFSPHFRQKSESPLYSLPPPRRIKTAHCNWKRKCVQWIPMNSNVQCKCFGRSVVQSHPFISYVWSWTHFNYLQLLLSLSRHSWGNFQQVLAELPWAEYRKWSWQPTPLNSDRMLSIQILLRVIMAQWSCILSILIFRNVVQMQNPSISVNVSPAVLVPSSCHEMPVLAKDGFRTHPAFTAFQEREGCACSISDLAWTDSPGS